MSSRILVHVDAGEANRFAAELVGRGSFVKGMATIAVRRTAAAIERDAKAFCPVDTGFLRDSISTTDEGSTSEVGPTAYYGVYVELGTSRMAPEAYLGPAFDRNIPQLQTALERLAALE